MSKSENNQNQGEGDREAARRFNEQEKQFTESKKGEKAIREGTHLSEAEAREAERKEAEGRQRAKEKDPQVVRDYKRAEH
jgi:hypothetical protein